MYDHDMTTRERLIDSTRELLWERGYVGTSPRAIQRLAGAGQGSMYHHFSGKPELARAAIERNAEQVSAAADVALSAGTTAYDRIAGYLHRERDVLRGCPVGRMAADPEVVADDDLRRPVAEALDRVRRRVAAIVAAGVEGGELTGVSPDEVAATVVATVQGGYVLARAAGSPEPFDAAVEGLLTMLRTTMPASDRAN